MSHVWYVSYGSNMSAARLACYLEGGCPPGGNRANPGARDRSLPARSVPVDLPGTTYFADRATHPDDERTPGVLVVRCESALLYFNVGFVRDRLFDMLADRPDPIRLVVFYLGAVPKVDLAGAELVAELHETLASRGVTFRLADAHGEVRAALRRIGFERVHGPLESGQTVHVVVTAWQQQART